MSLGSTVLGFPGVGDMLTAITIGAYINTYTILGAPFLQFLYNGLQNPVLVSETPIFLDAQTQTRQYPARSVP